MLKVDITEQGAVLDARLRRAVKKTAVTAVRHLGARGRLHVSLLITDDTGIRRLNRQYRQINKATDVLSFPSGEKGFLGDIAISLPRAATQADEYGHSLAREVAFLTAHAMLHLFGYDHMDEDEENAMRREQREILDKAGFGKP